MIRKIIRACPLVSCFAALSHAGEIAGRAEMEKHLFPLLMEADRIEILAVYPVPKELIKEQPNEYELSVVFGLYGDDAQKKMTDADRKMAALARKAPEVEGYPVLGKVAVTEPEEIKALLGEMRGMATAWDDGEPEESECHDPRHALRVTKGDRTLHFSICFDCGNTYISGLPEEAKPGASGFHHFKDELRAVLEKRLTEKGVIFLKAPEGE